MGSAHSADATSPRQEPRPTKNFENEDEKNLAPPLEEIAQKGNQTGKPVIRVHVMFDYIKSEIVKAAKAPDGQGQ
jgi:hypothetical protein